MDVAAVGTLPNHNACFLKDLLGINIFQESQVTLLMFFFDLADLLKEVSNLIKTFFTGFSGKLRIHIGPLIIFTGGRVFKTGSRIRNAVVEQFEPDFSMLLFIGGRLQKEVCDLNKSFFFRLGSVECVLIARLGFTRKCSGKVGGCLTSMSSSPFNLANNQDFSVCG